MNGLGKRFWLVGASSLTLSMTMMCMTPAAAQVASGAAPSGEAEEIVVTAQHRAEALQDVPIAVDAMSASQIEANGIHQLEDVQGRAAGVFFKNLNAGQPQVYIRGIGTVQFDNASEQPVGMFQDEIYLARHSAATTDLFDIERIEVLKGPQGTLYGRNTIGGAINVITAAPTRDAEGYVGAAVGNYSTISTRGAISGPISQTVSGRFAFITNRNDGFTWDPVTQRRANDANTAAARGRLRFEPNDRLTVDLTLDGTRDRTSGLQMELLGTQLLALPQVELTPHQPYVSQGNEPGHNRRDIWGITARADYTLSDALTLTSLTGYRANKYDGLRDLDAGPAPELTALELEDGHQFSQEVRLAFDSPRLRVIGGLYYFTESSKRTEVWDFLHGFGAPVGGDYSWTFDTTASSYAAFAQLDLNLLDDVTLSLGARYTHDDKSGNYVVASSALAPLPDFIENEAADEDPSTPGVQYVPNAEDEDFTARVSRTWQSLDPSLTLSWRVTPRAMLYVSYREGFKSGGFQDRPSRPSLATTPFNPETVRVAELGAKTEWFDHRLRLNLSAFHYDYRGLQQNNLIPGTLVTFTDNIGAATIQGAELEVTARPTNALELTAALSYLDATIDEYLDAAGNNYGGRRLPRAPRYAADVAAQYRFPLTSFGQLTARVEYNWRDDVYFLPQNLPIDFGPAVGLVNARITLTAPHDRITLALYGENLTEQVYCANQIVSVPQQSAATCVVGAPRQVGVSLLYNF